MTEPNMNDSEKILDALFERLAAEAGVVITDDAEDAGEAKLPQKDNYTFAQGMSERGDLRRPLRRSSSII